MSAIEDAGIAPEEEDIGGDFEFIEDYAQFINQQGGRIVSALALVHKFAIHLKYRKSWKKDWNEC